MALLVEIYKFPLGDCTNHGISSSAKSLCLVNVDGPGEPSVCHPAAFIVYGNLPGTVKIIPAVKTEGGNWALTTEWCMMGGNYAATSDSRFHDAVRAITGGASYGAVPIHDRIEK